MPAEARGHARKLPSGKWQLRWYDRHGRRRSGGAFPSKSAAFAHYREVIEPELHGRPAARRDLTLVELAEVFLERHGKVRSERTVRTLRERLKRTLDRFGDVPLAELDWMTDEVAEFTAGLPERWRHPLCARISADARRGDSLRLSHGESSQARGPEPAAAPTSGSRLHAG
jgi:hypothetical protein